MSSTLDQDSEALRFLSTVSEVIFGSALLDDTLGRCLDLTFEHLALDACSLYECTDDEPPRLIWHRDRDGVTDETWMRSGARISRVVTRHRRTLVYQADLLGDLASPRSLACLPWGTSDRVQGTMAVCAKRPVFLNEELTLLETVCRLVGVRLEQEKTVAEVSAANERLRQRLDGKNQMFGLIGHEIRNPLTIINGAYSVLQRWRELDEASFVEALELAAGEANRLVGITSNLLLLARADSEEHLPREGPSLLDQVETSVAGFRKGSPQRHVDVRVEPVVVLAVPTYLDEILRNLLDNANKYSRQETSLSISCEQGSAAVTLRVRDHGPGVRREKLETIFQRFSRDGGPAGSAPGMGLGLTLCRRLVELQGGRIWAELPDDGGLCVALTIPLAASND